jgi:hypothetical protein
MARHARRVGNLPAELTSFVGRRLESAELRKKLSAARLVTLVGPGGVGKTRLAIRAAIELQRGFVHGAWLVELADVRDAALVGTAFLEALDLRDQAASDPVALLVAYLRDKDMLLVVDNCEHLLDAAARLVSRLLGAAPAAAPVTADAFAVAYHIRGFLALLQADPVAARSALTRAQSAARQTRQIPLLSHALSLGSIGEHMAGDRASARRLARRSRSSH